MEAAERTVPEEVLWELLPADAVVPEEEELLRVVVPLLRTVVPLVLPLLPLRTVVPLVLPVPVLPLRTVVPLVPLPLRVLEELVEEPVPRVVPVVRRLSCWVVAVEVELPLLRIAPVLRVEPEEVVDRRSCDELPEVEMPFLEEEEEEEEEEVELPLVVVEELRVDDPFPVERLVWANASVDTMRVSAIIMPAAFVINRLIALNV